MPVPGMLKDLSNHENNWYNIVSYLANELNMSCKICLSSKVRDTLIIDLYFKLSR
jgi:hypothetical protein